MNAHAAVKENRYMSQKWALIIGRTVAFLFCVCFAIIVLAPVYWLFISAVKSRQEIALYPPTVWPKEWHFENFKNAFFQVNFTRFTLNTLLLAFFKVISQVFVNSFIAYGLSKIEFPGRGIVFASVLASMMLPGAVTLVPTYIMFAKMQWVGWYLPLIVPSFFGGAFNIFMMRQFYMTIPNELIEAAKVDGGNHFYIWSRLMTPLVKPVLATVAIITFKGAWNDFMGPLLYVRSVDWYTIQIGMNMFKGENGTQWNYIMAMSLLTTLPILILFFCFQNYFIQGMNVGGSIK